MPEIEVTDVQEGDWCKVGGLNLTVEEHHNNEQMVGVYMGSADGFDFVTIENLKFLGVKFYRDKPKPKEWTQVYSLSGDLGGRKHNLTGPCGIEGDVYINMLGTYRITVERLEDAE